MSVSSIISGYISESNNIVFIYYSLYVVNTEGILKYINLLGNKIFAVLPEPVVLPIFYPIITILGNSCIIWVNQTQQLKQVSFNTIYIFGN